MPDVWYKDRQKLKIGDIARYRFRVTNSDPDLLEVYLRVKNMEKTALRAVGLLNGPFVVYGHVVPCNYNHLKRFNPNDPEINREVRFHNSVKPGQAFNVRLFLNDNSLLRINEDGSRTYEWTCDIASQILLNRRNFVLFEIMIGEDLHSMRRLNRSPLTSLTKGDFHFVEESTENFSIVMEPRLEVKRQLTDDIWTVQPPNPEKPVHLVIVTHGLFSNLTADMWYLRDQIASVDDNIVVQGYRGNAGKTERGIHKLGVAVGAYVTELISQMQKKGLTVGSLSFVGHSLGGCVQLYAIKQILLIKGTDYFDRNGIALKHFVCMASPMLGVLSEMSLWISWFLNMGTLGKTGRDLALSKRLPHLRTKEHKLDTLRPILEVLPDEPVQSCLRSFALRTVYSNIINDGIVPLRTSALLYLDWEALGDVNALQKSENNPIHRTLTVSTQTNALGHDVGEIPAEKDDVGGKLASFLARSFQTAGDEEVKVSKRTRRYAKISVKSMDSESEAAPEDDVELSDLQIPPKASAVESALRTLMCPMPTRNYIEDPELRDEVICHDKFYSFAKTPEMPPKTGVVGKYLHYNDWRMNKQVKIARKYHTAEMSWRKVLVSLPPDAHNNIVVRRRFANGYGWGVVDHLRDEVFAPKLGKLTPKM